MDKKVKPTRPKNRRDEILREAAALFASAGYAGTSISMIADAVGVSKAALFHHYKDKSEIYASIVISVLEDLYNKVSQEIDPNLPATEQLQQFMEAQGSFIDNNFDSFRTAQSGFLGLSNPEDYKTAMMWRDRYESLIRSIIARGVKNGEFAIKNINLASVAVLSCLNWMARWYKPSGPLKAADFARQFSNLLLNGFLDPKSK